MSDSKVYLGQTSVIRRIRILDATGVPVTGLTAADIPFISAICDNESAPTVYDNVTPTIEGLDSATPGIYVAPTPTFVRFGEVDPTYNKGDYEIQLEDARFAVASSTELRINIPAFTTPVTATPAVSPVNDISYVVEIDSRDPDIASTLAQATAAATSAASADTNSAAAAASAASADANAAAAAGSAAAAAENSSFLKTFSIMDYGTITGGSTTTAVLSSSNYDLSLVNLPGAAGCRFLIHSGTGRLQNVGIASYNQGTQTVAFDKALAVAPVNGDTWAILYDYLPKLGSTRGVALVDVLTTYTGNTPQTGDVYAIANSGTFGNAAIKTLLDLVATYIDTEVAAIKAKTDNLPSDPADASDIAASFSSIASTLSTIAGYVDTEIAAIKAKTDNLPSDPADASDIAASFASVASTLSTIASYIDTEVAAIKAKTDALPSDPADASDIAASFVTVNAKLDAIDDFVDTEVSAIKAKTDLIPASPATEQTLATIAAYIDTEVAAIKAKTDNLPSDPADASDISASFASITSTLANISAFIDTEVAAIKSKTDNLPSDPADASDIASSFASVASSLSTIAAYIDTEVAAIKAKTDLIPASPAVVGSPMTLESGERNAIADAWTARNIEGGSSAGRTNGQAMAALRNKAVMVRTSSTTGTITVYGADDVTVLWSGDVTFAAGDPLASVDPS